ncbi:MAG: hypothetical protein PVJ15_08055 [Gammaproteobacteria bacterium]
MPLCYSLGDGLRALLLFLILGMRSLAAAAEWSVVDSVPGVAGCVLETEEISLFDGYQDTRLKLRVGDGVLQVRTDSNIDLGFDDVGLAVDDKDFVPADAIVDEKHIQFNAFDDGILEQFIRGRTVKLFLRFWPTYPATGRHEASFSLIGFTRAYKRYQMCRSQDHQ